ncbi:MAG: hypothetical protein GDA45_06380 [Chromatiales bacterium]|nr:hypothetical protein [Chromatiales bacterium]
MQKQLLNYWRNLSHKLRYKEGVEIEKFLKIIGLVLRDQVLEVLNDSSISEQTTSPDIPEPNPT